jgi:LmbE family N-acetylglucosaminyl deacetylase
MNSEANLPPLLAFGAHPDDIEFGCGGVIAQETAGGRTVHFVICSDGESGSNGSPSERISEARKAAAVLGAGVEFIELDGDAHLEVRSAHTLTLAAFIRRLKPGVILAPTLEQNQHPDHWRLGQLVRDAVRLARYGGVKELKPLPVHTVGQLLFYAVSPEAEPTGVSPVLIDVSAPDVLATWTRSMEAHKSQLRTRNYVELQLARSRVHGLRAGVGHALPLYPNDPLVFESLEAITRGARKP